MRIRRPRVVLFDCRITHHRAFIATRPVRSLSTKAAYEKLSEVTNPPLSYLRSQYRPSGADILSAHIQRQPQPEEENAHTYNDHPRYRHPADRRRHEKTCRATSWLPSGARQGFGLLGHVSRFDSFDGCSPHHSGAPFRRSIRADHCPVRQCQREPGRARWRSQLAVDGGEVSASRR